MNDLRVIIPLSALKRWLALPTGFSEFETHDNRAEAMTLLRIVILYVLLSISQL